MISNRIVNLTGRKYGRLKVLSFAGMVDNGKQGKGASWLCQCSCGNKIIVRAVNLQGGNTRSCHCLSKELSSKRCHDLAIKLNTKHNMTESRLYHIWTNMRCRCNNPNRNNYHRYGGRGMKVCSEWNDFTNFHKWAISHKYKEGLTIDRIDNNGNYEPLNCQWLTFSENASKDNYRKRMKLANLRSLSFKRQPSGD
jgi:hypothetical protein